MEKYKSRTMKIPKALIYISLLIFGVSMFTYLDFKDTSILYDDVYSVFMAKATYADIVDTTASDVHPPLYYWGLKAFSTVFGDSLFTLRLFSALGVISVLLLGCFPIRHLFGDKVAILFILLIIIFPVTQYLATDIRMYSWTMFFVLACALSAYRIFEKGRPCYWVLFFVTGLCAAYLHNYGLLSIFGIYILLLFFLIRAKKRWICLIICGLLFFVAYLPWLIRLFTQIGAVSADYWIKPLGLNDLFLHIYYFYSPKEVWLPFTHFSKGQMMTGLIILMIIQLALTVKVLSSGALKKDRVLRLAMLSFIAFLIPIVIGVVISVTFLPILVTRYMTCSFGLFVLSLAFVLARAAEYAKFRQLSYLFLIFLFIDGGVRFYSGMNYYNQTESAYRRIRDFVKAGGSRNTIFVVNDFSYHAMPRLQLIAPDNKCVVLVTDGKREDFRPFRFEEMKAESLVKEEFVLVHQDRKAVQEDFRRYRQLLNSRYMAIDSLHATDIHLYRMKRTIP